MQKKYTLISYLLAASLLFSACNSLKIYTDLPGKFTVQAPVELEETVKSVDSSSGPIDVHLYTASYQNVVYLVSYTDYNLSTSDLTAEEMLGWAISGLFGSGQILENESITLGTYPGRELVVAEMDENGVLSKSKARLYMVGNRLYELLVTGPEESFNEADAERFLESFALSEE